MKKSRILILTACLAMGGVVQALAHEGHDVILLDRAHVLAMNFDGQDYAKPKNNGLKLPALSVDVNTAGGSVDVGLGGVHESVTDAWLFGSVPVPHAKVTCSRTAYVAPIFEVAWRSS